jgi:AbiU2
MTKELVEKLKGHTDHVLGLYLLLAEKYALIDPMFFGKRVVRRFGVAERARGFDLIRKAVYFGCLQDLANICFDQHDKTPSISKLVGKLRLLEIQKLLRDNYSQYPINMKNSDPNIRASLQKYRAQQEAKLAERFDRELKSLIRRWDRFATTPRARAFESIRDKITAHFELEKTDGVYGYVPVSRFDLRWSDLRRTITELRPIVEILNSLIRNAGMDVKSTIAQHNRYGKSFWK